MSSRAWVKKTPIFECDRLNPEMLIYSPWAGHRRFVYDFVANIEPKCIVELGSYYGCSAFTFLQAIKDQGLSTSFYAIDTWEGDSFTKGDYKENIFESYKRIQDEAFSKQNSYMLRMTFDEANSRFEDGTIDLLHIDGSHTYEDCRHDFEVWLPKVNKNGFVFFHDVSDDKLNGELLGSHIFWEEVKKNFPYTMEFPFSFGLGILFFNEEVYREVCATVDMNYYQQLENNAAVVNKDVIRKQFFEIRDARIYINFLKNQLSVSNSNIEDYKDTQKKKDIYINELESKNEKLSEEFKRVEADSRNLFSEYEKKVSLDKEELEEKDRAIEGLNGAIKHLEEVVCAKEDYVKSLDGKVREICDTLSEKEETIGKLTKQKCELQKSIDGYVNDIEEKEMYIQGLLATNTELVAEGHKKDYMLSALEQQNDKMTNSVVSLQCDNQEYEARIFSLEAEIKKAMEIINKDREKILSLQQGIGVLNKQLNDMEEYLEKIPFGRRIIKKMEI